MGLHYRGDGSLNPNEQSWEAVIKSDRCRGGYIHFLSYMEEMYQFTIKNNINPVALVKNPAPHPLLVEYMSRIHYTCVDFGFYQKDSFKMGIVPSSVFSSKKEKLDATTNLYEIFRAYVLFRDLGAIDPDLFAKRNNYIKDLVIKQANGEIFRDSVHVPPV